MTAIPSLSSRPGEPADAVLGLTPEAVLTPDTGAAVAAVLRYATDEGLAVQLRGSGTKLDWGRAADRLDLVLDMRRLNSVLEHEAGDLTATIQSGARLADVNALLARRGQWLPLDPSCADRATIGGIIATNDSGSLRHRYGTPRDLLIGMRFASADGVLAKAGGKVVKNVAGYDISRLAAGSFGGLVAIIEATFKLSPLPRDTHTVTAQLTADGCGALVTALMASQLEPMAFDLDGDVPPEAALASRWITVSVQFNSPSGEATRQAVATQNLLAKAGAEGCRVLTEQDEHSHWRARARPAEPDAGTLLKLNWLPATLVQLLSLLTTLRNRSGTPIRLAGRAALGAGTLELHGSADNEAAIIGTLRESALTGHVVICRASADLRRQVDVWPSAGSRALVLTAVKRALDPRHILSPGRGPV